MGGPASFPHVNITGAAKTKFHGRRGSPLNGKKRLTPNPQPGRWTVSSMHEAIRAGSWDKGLKSAGALAFVEMMSQAGVVLSVEAAIKIVPLTGYDGYFSGRYYLVGLLRRALAEAAEADWSAAETLAESLWSDNPRVSRTIAALFPHRADWAALAAEGALAEWAEMKATSHICSPENLLDQELLLGTAARPEQLMALLEDGHFFSYLHRSEHWWIDWVELTGAAAAPVLAFFHTRHPSYNYQEALSRVVSLVISRETIASAASRLGDWEKTPKAEIAFLRQAPELAVPALEEEVRRYAQTTTRKNGWGKQRNDGANRARELLETLRGG